jgi:hypothetical protein
LTHWRRRRVAALPITFGRIDPITIKFDPGQFAAITVRIFAIYRELL